MNEKVGGRKMQKITETTSEDVARLQKRVQHLEEEVAKIKMKMGGKKWL